MLRPSRSGNFKIFRRPPERRPARLRCPAKCRFSRYVGRRHDGNHAGRGAHLAQIEAAQPSALDRRAADRDMQRADRFGDVIEPLGLVLDVNRDPDPRFSVVKVQRI